MRIVSIALTAAVVLGACGKGKPRPADVANTAERDMGNAAERDTAAAASAEPDANAEPAPSAEPATLAPIRDDELPGSPRQEALGKAVQRLGVRDSGPLGALLASDVTLVLVGSGDATTLTGRHALLEKLGSVSTPVEHLIFKPEHLFEAGGWVIVDVVVTGRYTGDLPQARGGKPFGVAFALACRYGEAGPIDRVEAFFNGAAFERQLGLRPPPTSPMQLISAPTDEPIEYSRGAASPANEALTRQALDAQVDGSLDAKWDTLFSPRFIFDDASHILAVSGKAPYIDFWREPTVYGVRRGVEVRVERALSMEDRVVTWTVLTDTAPGGTKLEEHVLDIWTVVDDRITKRRSFTNELEVLAKL